MPLTIGMAISLKKWVALKWALTDSAHMMLQVEEEKQEKGLKMRKDRRGETTVGKRQTDNGRM